MTSGTTRTLTLRLDPATISDGGSYTCSASYASVAGTLETEEVELFVRGWVKELGDSYTLDGETAFLTCIAKTESEPVVSW